MAQDEHYSLSVITEPPTPLQFNPTYPSIDSINYAISTTIQQLIDEGYLAAALDSLVIGDEVVNAQIFVGQQYVLQQVSNGNLPEVDFSKLFGVDRGDENLSWKELSRLKAKLLEQYNNNGFLEAQVWLDNFAFQQNQVSTSVFADPGNQYVFDSLIVRGNLDVQHQYLKNYFSLKKGQAIQPDWLEKIHQRADQSTFFKLENKPGFLLDDAGNAQLVLELNDKASNEFDLVLGFLPNPNPQLSSRNLLLTGEGSLKLYNPLGGARTLAIDYKQLQPESPRIDLDLVWPTFFEQPLGATANFELIKQDSSFVNVNFNIGAQYQLGGNNYLRFFFKRSDSFLQEIDTAFIRQNRSLEQAIDYNQNLYGAKVNWDQRNNSFNPQRGYWLLLTSAIGNRSVEPNSTITSIEDTSFDFSTIYNGLNDRKLTTDIEFLGQYFIPLKQRSTILLQNNTGYRDYDNYFGNDLYRLGGLFSVRGVDEQSILASKYSITSLEYRFLLGEESFFSVFSDGAWVTDERETINTTNFYTGLGTGIDLATQAGIFTLNLAVAQDKNTTFDFNRSRIHIGYVNRF